MIELFVYLAGTPILLVVICAGVLSQVSVQKKPLIFSIVFSFMLSPSWAPATIAAIPMPFGAMFGVSLFGGFIHELGELLLLFWWWHIVVFPVMAILGYCLGKFLFKVKTERQAQT